MYDLVVDDLFFYRKLKIRKKFSNEEIQLYQYFHSKTKLNAENIIVYRDFVFFFVKNNDYYKAKLFLKKFRRELDKKVLMIRTERTLIKLLHGFFPDLCIHDILIEMDNLQREKVIKIYFLSFEDRGIAIGRNGNYIKAVNEIFKKFVILEKKGVPLRIKCNVLNW